MESKLSRIAAFIDSLPAESGIEQSSSMILTSHLDFYGGATNANSCENKGTGCYDSENQKTCVNVGICGGATNKAGCSTVDPPITGNLNC